MTTSDEATERRLSYEAQQRLGTLIHQDVRDRSQASAVLVEVTYQLPGEIEHAGHYVVWVPSIEMTGDDEHDLAHHPATLATEKVHDWVNEKGYDYFSVDDVYAA